MKNHTSMTATDAQNQFGSCLKHVMTTSNPVLIEKHGKPVAALVDYESWSAVQSHSTATNDEWIDSCRSLLEKIKKSQTSSIKLLRQLREDQS